MLRPMLGPMRKLIDLWSERPGDLSEDAAAEAAAARQPPKPALWLLGKTGAGKSSLIRALTGLDAAVIGDGFQPCTRTSQVFDHPPDRPVMRFLDTRGLGEAGYDPAEDLKACEDRAHLVLALARLDDPVQGEVAAALGAVRRRKPRTPVVVVHTAADLVPEEQERFRAQAANQRALETAAGDTLPSVTLALPPEGGAAEGLDALIDHLGEVMPEVALLLAREDLRDAERAAFARRRAAVVWYARAAGAVDVTPVVGAVGAPALQAAMLRTLARSYGVAWTRGRMAQFVGALGVGVGARFLASYGARQAAKLIPVFGQSVGAAASGAVSFAATYALGRAAAYFLHRARREEAVAPEALREVFRDALKGARRED